MSTVPGMTDLSAVWWVGLAGGVVLIASFVVTPVLKKVWSNRGSLQLIDAEQRDEPAPLTYTPRILLLGPV